MRYVFVLVLVVFIFDLSRLGARLAPAFSRQL